MWLWLNLLLDVDERRFRREMRERGRWLPWNALLPKLRVPIGTLIIEQGDLGPSYGLQDRVWYTAEDVAKVSPYPLPPREALWWVAYQQPHPFIPWCQERYFAADRGIAVLTKPKPNFDRPELELGADFYSRLFPGLQVVDTGRYRPECLKCGYNLTGNVSGLCPECGARTDA